MPLICRVFCSAGILRNYFIELENMKNYILPVLIGILFAQCSGIQVASDYSPNVDFTQYKTFEFYGWVDDSNEILSHIDQKRIEKAFSEELKSRGLTYVEDGGELIVALFVVAEEKTRQTAVTTHVGVGYGGYYGYGPAWGWSTGYSSTSIDESKYKQGTLVCDIYDKEEELLIWEGIGTKKIEKNPYNREKVIPYIIKKMMAGYPVKPQ